MRDRERGLLCCSFCVYVPPLWTCLQNGLCSSWSEKTLLSLLVIWARYSRPEERTKKGGGGAAGGGRESEVKKGLPSSYGIYLPASLSRSSGRGPKSGLFCELSRNKVAVSAQERWTASGFSKGWTGCYESQFMPSCLIKIVSIYHDKLGISR